ncbi:hypothetical protein ACFOOK_00955 [Micromonospora krabiensis]|uniref:hypothetical protein n=1 Tax=Micromonospora krabiensis TaxID=307121 RepID=UPI0036134F0F
MTKPAVTSHDLGGAPRAQVAITVLLIVVGVLVLFVPAGDEGRVLVPISEGHGLSAVDGIGATLLAVGGHLHAAGIVLVVAVLPHLLALAPRGPCSALVLWPPRPGLRSPRSFSGSSLVVGGRRGHIGVRAPRPSCPLRQPSGR